MQNWIVSASLVSLLLGIFVLRNIRLGILMGLLLYILPNVWLGKNPFGTALLDGFIITFELTLLIFGALVFYNLLAARGHFAFIQELIAVLPSRLVVVLILCMFLGSFFEGIAGFGVPAMLVAPLLLRAGFQPFSTIIISLTANICAVTFGALGTPLKIGFQIHAPETATNYVLLFNILPIFAIPFIVAYLFGQTEKVEILWQSEWKRLLGAGICFVIPYLIVGQYSVEFPTVVAGGAGLVLFMLLFVKTTRPLGTIFWLRAFYPYLVFIGLLLLFRAILQGQAIHLGANIRPIALYQPGWIFLLAIFLYFLLVPNKQSKAKHFSVGQIMKETLQSIQNTVLTILLLVSYTQLVRANLVLLIGQGFALLPATLQKVGTMLVGVSGAFLTGSATMSNLLFRDLAIQQNFLPQAIAIALLHTGSALGNIIALQNIVMAKSVVSAQNSESEVIRYNLLTVVIYTTLVLGMLFAVLAFQ